MSSASRRSNCSGVKPVKLRNWRGFFFNCSALSMAQFIALNWLFRNGFSGSSCLLSASQNRDLLRERFAVWHEVVEITILN